MIEIVFTPAFDRAVRKLDAALLEEVSDTVEKLKNARQHEGLKIHKLHGRLKGLQSASVDYRHRIVFQWVTKSRILLLDFGDHSVYE